MMRARCVVAGIVVLLMLPAAGPVAFAQAESKPELPRWVLLSGEWAYNFRTPQAARPLVAAPPGGITGFALEAKTFELGLCAAGEAGTSALWVAPVEKPYETPMAMKSKRSEGLSWFVPKFRKLWTAPAGDTLRGPMWWSPDGSQVALRAFKGEAAILVVVEGETGEASWLTHGAAVQEVCWSPFGTSLAYASGTGEGAVGVHRRSLLGRPTKDRRERLRPSLDTPARGRGVVLARAGGGRRGRGDDVARGRPRRGQTQPTPGAASRGRVVT